MSRVGMNPIPVPDGVDVAIDGAHVTVAGNRGTLEHDLPETISARIEDGFVVVERADEQRNTKALHGLSRSLLANMVTGVS
ncbi:MAG: 50S ribosomal protein L6, partial [Acidimicrobiia bacterium]|nr:50S ribosomal protein L6 [Acidimicrobiia bacterium]